MQMQSLLVLATLNLQAHWFTFVSTQHRFLLNEASQMPSGRTRNPTPNQGFSRGSGASLRPQATCLQPIGPAFGLPKSGALRIQEPQQLGCRHREDRAGGQVLLREELPPRKLTRFNSCESQSKPGTMVYPESCEELRSRPQLFIVEIVPY